MLPIHFGPWQTVYWWFRRFVRRFLFRTIHDVALMLDRDAAGREASPTGGVLDSHTVKVPFAEVRGYDGGKRIVGRKRHVAVDTDGWLLMVKLTPADVSDSAGAQEILAAVRKCWPWLKHRDRPALREKRLPRPPTALGGGAHLRLDDPLAPPRPRLRATPRRLQGHDPRRYGGPASPQDRPPLNSQTVTKSPFRLAETITFITPKFSRSCTKMQPYIETPQFSDAYAPNLKIGLSTLLGNLLTR